MWQSEYHKEYYEKNKDHIREAQRVWKIKNREKSNGHNKKWYVKYGAENERERRKREPYNYTQAHSKLRNAVRSGKIDKKPCIRCGSKISEGHHYKGYEPENWLTVQWLCRRHHYDAEGRSTKPLES